EVIRQRIESCKQQLAANVLPSPSAPAAQRQLEELADKNRQLQGELEKWRAYYAAQQAAIKANPTGPQNTPAQQPSSGSPIPDDMSQPAPAATTAVTPVKPAPAKVSPARTHAVVAGETLAAIARKHNVSLAALQAANPGVSPKKMRVGQVLNLPPP
ncbi:MAG: LysM peptidoglycan-binding domain-containing protein, partial [Verrucomicrobiota bacterium]